MVDCKFAMLFETRDIKLMAFIYFDDVQYSMHLHLFAPIWRYAAFKKQVNKQINMANIYIRLIYTFKAQYMHI